MPSLIFAKSTLGAIVDVSLTPSSRATQALGRAPCVPVQFKMLIDTGADTTAVDAMRVGQWALNPVSFYLSQSMGGVTHVPLFDLAVTIIGPGGSGAWRIDPLLISARPGSPFAGCPFDGVIGRDVLDKSIFIYNGLASHCTLAY